jgi:hypothetical protein
MSKLARVLAVGALLTAMSLGSTAHAQDGAQSQQAGITQSDPSPTPPPGENPTPPPGENPPPPPGENPPPPPGDTPTPPPGDTPTQPPVPRPITVKVSPQAGGPGTTVNVSADVSGCTQPKSAKGTFGSAARPLIRQGVIGGRFTAQYLVTNRDPVGLGRFGVVCDNTIRGFAPFLVQPSRSPVSVRVTPQAGGRGTVVRITAEVGQCRYHYAYFYDSKADGVTIAGGAKPIKPLQVTAAGRLTASYTITNKDATGSARFSVGCGYEDGTARFGEASFRVLAPNGGGTDGNDPVDNPNKPTQLPKRIDTGQGGTADGISHDGLDPMLLLPAAGLLLITLAAGLWLRQTTTRRRQ